MKLCLVEFVSLSGLEVQWLTQCFQLAKTIPPPTSITSQHTAVFMEQLYLLEIVTGFLHPPTTVNFSYIPGSEGHHFLNVVQVHPSGSTSNNCKAHILRQGGSLCLVKVFACFLCILFLFTQNPCLTSKLVFS